MVAIDFAIGLNLMVKNSEVVDTFAVKVIRPGMVHDQSFANADVPFQVMQPMPILIQHVQRIVPTSNRERIVVVHGNVVQIIMDPLVHYERNVEERMKEKKNEINEKIHKNRPNCYANL